MNYPDNANSPQHSSMKVTVKKTLIPVFIIAFGFAIYAIMKALAPEPEKIEVEQKPQLVKVVEIKKEDLRIPIFSQGNVSAISESVLTAQVAGNIIQVSSKFADGGYFAKGDRLLTIDDTDYQVALLEAQARLTIAQANLQEEQARVKQAKDEWRLSGKALSAAPVLAVRLPQLQKAQAELTLAEAVVKSAKIQLSRTVIQAPYNAIIRNTQVDVGQYVSSGNTLATIISVETAKVRLPIKQQDMPFILLPSLQAQVMKDTQVNSVNTSKVELSSITNHKIDMRTTHLIGSEGVVDNTSRVQFVVAVIDDPYNLKGNEQRSALPVGSFVQAEIQGKILSNVTRIPRSAVIGKNTVYLFSHQKTLMIQSIDIIRTDKHYVYTQDSLPENARLITTELSLPIKGMLLRVRDFEANDTPKPKFSVSQSN